MKKYLALFFVATALFAALPGPAPTLVAALSTTTVRVSATPCYLVGYNFSNPNSYIVYVQVFDAATTGAVTLGSTAPTASIAIPPLGVTDSAPTNGIAFQHGIVVAATTTATGSTAPTTAIPANFYVN